MFIKDNDRKIIKENESNALKCIANRTVKQLTDENDNLFILSGNRKDKIKEKTIFNLYTDHSLQTFNLAGFIGVGDFRIDIGSRFSEENGKQYFIQYMLQCVYNLPLIDLKTTSGNTQLWEQLLYIIFPVFLKKAYNQGLFKIYQKKFYNDSNVKGKIDIPRHIKSNRPFIGNVAYNVKELSINNPITQLVRHAIEFISSKNGFSQVLSGNPEIHNAVRIFKSITPDYNIRDRQKMILQNMKKVNHPFFTEYEPLRQLCIQILTHEGISFHNSPNKIHGILIDVAWLWEEYLNTVLKIIEFIHPENINRTGRIHLFKDKQELYPDFYNTKMSMVIDAKYKKLQVGNKISREDIYQVVTYMYRLQAKFGILLYPIEADRATISEKQYQMHEESYGGSNAKFHTYGMEIPKENSDFIEFINKVKEVEEKLKKTLNLKFK